MSFKKATKAAAKLRLGLIGPAGSGKTMTALRVAHGLGGRVAVIDTERGSASLYSGERGLDFDVLELDSYEAEKFIQAIAQAEASQSEGTPASAVCKPMRIPSASQDSS